MNRIPINEAIMYAVAKLVDDSMSKEKRQPSHSEITYLFKSSGINEGDPNRAGNNPVGKAKRVRGALSWAIENTRDSGEKFVFSLLTLVKSSGGFRPDSANFVGEDAISNLRTVLRTVNYFLDENGSFGADSLESLSGEELTKSLRIYVERAKRGIEDAALQVGTGKDLLEAVAAHILTELWGQYNTKANFIMLMGQAFTALDLSTDRKTIDENRTYFKNVETATFEMACAINNLRNKEGTGHGRPWSPKITENEAKIAIEQVGIISEFLLNQLERKRQN